ncbi:helix-turn-helix domain-containing protein [Celeribacter sp.]|uniref:helix-turn-helix domain-containing protein n=1 Tax=Celeribacter sp. TaxID=1890673 RepID=UPI003A94BA50
MPANRIFNTPPLGNLSEYRDPPRAKSHDRQDDPATPPKLKWSKTTQKAKRVVRVPDIPEPAAYRVEPLARTNGQGDKWRTKAMRSHRSPTLIWFTRGQGRLTVSGVTRGFGPHNLVYLPTGTMYGFEPIGQVYGSIIHLPQADVATLPDEPLQMRFTEVIQQNEITGLIEGLAREIADDRPERDRAMALQAGLISVWLERQIAVMPDYDLTPDASRRLVAAYTSLVEKQFHESHSVSHYAAALGVTPTHLSRACNTANGQPASKIIADRVQFEARRLLAETDLPVAAIAEKLGFHSPAYFSRAFHKAAGMSPRDYRKSL